MRIYDRLYKLGFYKGYFIFWMAFTMVVKWNCEWLIFFFYGNVMNLSLLLESECLGRGFLLISS